MSPSQLLSRFSLLFVLTVPGLAAAEKVAPGQRPQVDVAFVLDTTSSMTGLIEGAKQKIWSIASEIARGQPAPILRVALVAYRDVGDEYVVKRFDFTKDLDAVHAQLRQLRAEGGGDSPEHVGRGLGEAVKYLSWNQERSTMKLLFLVGDAPPQRYGDGWDAWTWATHAGERGIVVNAVRCGANSETGTAWQQLAVLAKGTFSTIDGSGGMLAVTTPYDAKLAELNTAIARTSLYVGSREGRVESKKKADAVAALEPTVAADRMTYFGRGKAGGVATTAAPPASVGAKDLAAAPESLAALKEEELDDSLRAMKPEARRQYVEKRAQERKGLEAEADKLAKQRDAFLAAQASEKGARGDAFDQKVLQDIRSRGAAYGIAY